MLKKFIRRLMPDHEKIRSQRQLRILGTLLHDPNLFHINRRSIPGAFAVGLFMAWVPLPIQMLLAAAVAILVRVNLPLSVALVWISNPFTMPPLFYFAYRVGAWLLDITPGRFHFEPTFEWLNHGLIAIWQPFLLVCAVLGIISSALGYAVIKGWWRLHILHQRKLRSQRPSRPSRS